MVYHNLISCMPCGEGCEKPVVIFDTHMAGYCKWLHMWADYKMRSGRTVKDHELQHLINDWDMIQSVDEKLHSIGDESCVTVECCKAKKAYYESFEKYKKAETKVSQKQLDWDDFTDGDRKDNNVAEKLREAKEALEEARTVMNTAESTMNKKCKK